MFKTKNPNEAKEMSKVDKIAEVIAEVVQKLPQLTAFEVSALHKQRVFNRGENPQGQQIQYKSEYYKKKRQQAGRQTNYIDFEFEGKLRRSLKVGEEASGQIVYGVDDSMNENVSNKDLLSYINNRFDDFMIVSEDEKNKAIETAQRFFKDNVIKGINEIR
jgi:hypothetical protein